MVPRTAVATLSGFLLKLTLCVIVASLIASAATDGVESTTEGKSKKNKGQQQVLARCCANKKNSTYRGDSASVSHLLDNLIDGYDKRLRPNYNGDPVEVGITMFVSSVSQVSEANMVLSAVTILICRSLGKNCSQIQSSSKLLRLRPNTGRCHLYKFAIGLDDGGKLNPELADRLHQLQDFTVDFYFRQYWKDNRLNFSDSDEEELCISNDMLAKIWWPDTFFANAKQANFHQATTHNAFLRIKPQGEITQSLRLTVTATCSMDLTYFPMDSQICSLEIESYAYSVKHIMYFWKDGRTSVKVDDNVRLPQFRVRGINPKNKTEKLSTGVYSRLACEFYLVRSLGYYIIHIYVPSCLIVVLSWISFWLHRDASPARVALGITTVLTMTTVLSNSNSSLPKISYLKSIDIFLVTCFSMVFASLLEYACVSFIGRAKPPATSGASGSRGGKSNRRSLLHGGGPNKRRRSNDATVTSRLLEMESSIGGDGAHVTDICLLQRPRYNGPMHLQQSEPPLSISNFGVTATRDVRTPLSCRPLAAASQCPAHSANARCYDPNSKLPPSSTAHQPTAASATGTEKAKVNRNVQLACSIDKYSRVVFPCVFLGFNVVYWVVFLNISPIPNEDDFVIRE